MGEGSPDQLDRDLAEMAHRCWCDRMARSGWVWGPRFDEGMRTHDALRPFESLNPRDRRSAIEAVRDMGVQSTLADMIEYERGADREFTLEEMQPGLPVAMVVETGEEEAERGVVESWEVDARTSLLRVIRVRWSDGEVSEHHVSARELRRVAP